MNTRGYAILGPGARLQRAVVASPLPQALYRKLKFLDAANVACE